MIGMLLLEKCIKRQHNDQLFYRFHMNMQSKMLGATFIVIGTSIGAGMLAMPIISAGIGYKYSVLILVFMWVLMTAAAYVQLSLFKNKPIGISFAKLVFFELGSKAKIIPSIVKILLFYSLLSAYMSGSSSFLAHFFQISNNMALIIFALLFGIIVSTTTKIVDITNRLFLFAKFLTFLVVIILLLPQTSGKNLYSSNNFDKSVLLTAISVFFTSYGFHGSIPSLVTYLKNNQIQLKKSFLAGSLIIMLVYILWQTVTLGSVSSDILYTLNCLNKESNIAVFLDILSKKTAYPCIVPPCLSIFSFCAMVTSFLGVGLGQFDYIYEISETHIKGSKYLKKLIASILTIIIPLIFALFYKNGFIKALNFASIWLAILALVLPGVMGFTSLNNKEKIMSFICLFAGIILIIISLLN
jgi:tyrosine-specific transport protein